MNMESKENQPVDSKFAASDFAGVDMFLSNQELKAISRLADVQITRYNLCTRTAERFYSAWDRYGIDLIEENVPDSVVESGLISEDTVDEYRRIFEEALSGKASGSAEMKIRNVDGDYSWHHVDFSLIYNPAGDPVFAIFTFFDNALRRAANFSYDHWKSGLSALIDESILYVEVNLSENKIVLQEGSMPYRRNGSDCATFEGFVDFGYNHLVYPEDLGEYCEFFDRKRLLNLYYVSVFEDTMDYRLKDPINGVKWVRANVRMIKDSASDVVMAIIAYVDIDRQHREMDRLAIMASHDPLTGILNRDAMQKEIANRLASLNQGLAALFIIDLDNFKQVNDTLGHQHGDEVLRQTAATLSQVVEKIGLAGRLGGDEFMIFVDGQISQKQIEGLAVKLINDLQFYVGGIQHITVSASIGLAICGGNTDFDTLYAQADNALYEAKSDGKCQYHVFSGGDCNPKADEIDSLTTLSTVHLQSLLEYMGGGVILAKVDGQLPRAVEVAYASPSYFKSMGFTSEIAGINGEKLLSFVHEDDLPKLLDTVRQVADDHLSTERVYRAKIPNVFDFSWRHMHITYMPGGTDNYEYVICIISDISNLKFLENYSLV